MSLAAVAAWMTVMSQDPDAGVSLELARARAQQITATHYDLEFTLAADSDVARGRAVIRFTLKGDPPARGLVLDCDCSELTDLRLNGVAADGARRVHDHLVFPAERLSDGENEIEVTFTSAIAATGTPLTRYRDTSTGKQYLYTLLVPADAHRLFPCFDQPDLKATFALRVHAPAAWQVVGNAEVEDHTARSDGTATWPFAPSEKISTYLFAFSAGEWEVLESTFPLRAGKDKERRMRLSGGRAARRQRFVAEAHARVLAGHSPTPPARIESVVRQQDDPCTSVRSR